MIPSVYVAIEEIPTTNTGKVDRRRLQVLGSALTVSDIYQDHHGHEETRVLTPAEKQMKKLWANILHADEEDLHLNDSFLLIGGDSILAMKLVGKAREKGFTLTVTDVLRKPRLSDMALALGNAEPLPIVTNSTSDKGPSRMNIPTNYDISELLQLAPANMLEILPVTDFQTLCLEGNIQSPRKWWANLLIHYTSSSINPEQVVARCLQLWEAFDILRSNYVVTNGRYWQVLTQRINPSIEILQVSGQIQSYINRVAEEEELQGYHLGKAATGFTIVHNDQGQISLRVGLSHAQYDGICLPQMIHLLGDVDGVQAFDKPASFGGFFRHASMVRDAGVAYWRELLKGSYPTHLPRLIRSSNHANASINGHTAGPHAVLVNGGEQIVCLKAFSQIPHSDGSFSAATVFSTACALALSKATGSSDITFGRVVSGRSALPPHLQNVFGPCINFVPLRVQLDQNISQQQVLHSVHNQYVNSLLYETVGFKDIINECANWKDDYFGCTVQYQNIANPTGTVTGDHYNADFWRSGRIGIGGPWLEIFAMPVDNELEITILSKVHDRDILQQTLDDIVLCLTELR
jgi:aryl carrier-like protein